MSKEGRTRSVDSIIKEIEYLINNYNGRNIFFTDDVFFANVANLQEFYEKIKHKKIHINYNAQLRVNMITDDVCKFLKDSGCVKIEVGVESGSDEILKNCTKGVSVEDIRHGISIAKANGLRIKTNWIYGLPGTLNEQYKSVDLMTETKPNEISIHQLIPFPGTEYYNNCEKYGIKIKEPKNFKSFCYGYLDDNISYDYMNKSEYLDLLNYTVNELEKNGYISSDKANMWSEYVYTTPLENMSLIPINNRIEK